MAKRCLLITYYFPPTGGGGVQRLVKLIKYAGNWGWQFTVFTALEAQNQLAQDPSLLREIAPQTQIIRLPFALGPATQKSLKANYVTRWLSAFLFVPDSRKKWMEAAWQKVRQILKQQPFDLVLISIPPYSLSFLASRIRNHFSVPVVLDVRDPWTMNPYKIHPTLFHRWLDRRMERKAMGQVQFGISAYRRLLDFYESTIPDFQRNNWRVIPNGYDEEDFQGLAPGKAHEAEFKIGFSGTIYSHLNHPTPLFKAMALLNKKWPAQGAKLRFVHVGKANIDLPKLADRFGLRNQVQSLGYLPHQQALAALQEMDSLCFILDDRDKRSRFTIGGKVYEYLRLKRPILALVPEQGEAADLLRKTKSGVVISPQKTNELAHLLLQWLKGQNLRFEFKNIEQFRRDLQARQFVTFFDEILRR